MIVILWCYVIRYGITLKVSKSKLYKIRYYNYVSVNTFSPLQQFPVSTPTIFNIQWSIHELNLR